MNKVSKDNINSFLIRNKINNPYVYGVWRVRGESDGSYTKEIGTFEGMYLEILEYVSELPNFWGYGGGGSIDPVNIVNIKKLKEEKANDILKEISDLEMKLVGLRKYADNLKH